QREAACARLTAVHSAWTATAGPLGVPAATPAELRAWLRRRDEVVQGAEHVRAARQALVPLDRGRNEQGKALERALIALGEALPEDDDGRLSGRLARAEDVLEREEKTVRTRDKLRTQVDEIRADVAREQLALAAAEDE